MKAAFAWLDRDYSPLLANLALRLKLVQFGMERDWQTLGVDVTPSSLSVELLWRKECERIEYDATGNKAIVVKSYKYALRAFTIDAARGYISTPNAHRDLGRFFADVLQPLVAPNASLSLPHIDLSAWARAFISQVADHAQLGNIVLDQFYAEPKLLGRYGAKAIDNRLDLNALADKKLRSLKLAFYEEGAKRSVEARTDGVLTCTGGDAEALEHFMDAQTRLYIGCAQRPALQVTVDEAVEAATTNGSE